jgi:hypothetical protein
VVNAESNTVLTFCGVKKGGKQAIVERRWHYNLGHENHVQCKLSPVQVTFVNSVFIISALSVCAIVGG